MKIIDFCVAIVKEAVCDENNNPMPDDYIKEMYKEFELLFEESNLTSLAKNASDQQILSLGKVMYEELINEGQEFKHFKKKELNDNDLKRILRSVS